MSTNPFNYYRQEDFAACKELRESYLLEAEGEMRHAMLAICLDMIALDAYVADIEKLAMQHGLDLNYLSGSRPRPSLTAILRTSNLESAY